MRTVLIIALLLLVIPAAAQSDCGFGVPCQPAPWNVPALPTLKSPTPYVVNGNALVATSTPSPAPTTIPTLTPFFDTGGIGNAVSTINAINAGTVAPVVNFQGTPVARATLIAQLPYGEFVGYVKGIDTGIAGPFQPLLNIGVIGFLLILAIKAVSFLLPVFMAIFGFIRKLVNVVLEFIPL